jgi:hypothetical protein
MCQRIFLRSCKEVTIHFLHNFVLYIVVHLITSPPTWKTISSTYFSTLRPHIHTSPCMQCLVSLTSEDRVCQDLEMNTQTVRYHGKSHDCPSYLPLMSLDSVQPLLLKQCH